MVNIPIQVYASLSSRSSQTYEPKKWVLMYLVPDLEFFYQYTKSISSDINSFKIFRVCRDYTHRME